MAYSQTQIDVLHAAIASGVLSVRHENTTTEYRSLDEMREILAEMEKSLGITQRVRRTVASFSRGIFR